MATQDKFTSFRSSSSSSSSLVSSLTFQIGQRRHPASLLPTVCHNPSLLHIVSRPITIDMITWVAQMFTAAIDVEEGVPQSMLPTPPATPNKSLAKFPSTAPVGLPPLEEFIARLVQRSGAHVATFLSTVIYLERLCAALSKQKGIPCTRHRVFLATLIVSAKYLNDSGPKNCNWTEYAQWFTNSEVNLMESQLLSLLDYRLGFTEDEACKHFAPFMTNVRGDIRQTAVSRVIAGSKARETREILLTPSSFIDGSLPPNVTPSQPCTPRKRSSQGVFMPLLNAAKYHRSWTRCHHRQPQNHSSFPNSAVAVPPLGPVKGFNGTDVVCKSEIGLDSSRSFPYLELVNGMDLMTLSSTPSSSSGASSQTSALIEDVPEPIHTFSSPDHEKIHGKTGTAHLSGSVSSLAPALPIRTGGPFQFDDNRSEAEFKPLAVKTQLDSFLRKMFGSRQPDKLPGIQGYHRLMLNEEKAYRATRHSVIPEPFRDCIPVAPDQQFEPMVVC